MHRPRIAVDAEISGATAEVIRVSRAAHSGVARRAAAGRVDRDWPVRSRHLTNYAAQRCIARVHAVHSSDGDDGDDLAATFRLLAGADPPQGRVCLQDLPKQVRRPTLGDCPGRPPRSPRERFQPAACDPLPTRFVAETHAKIGNLWLAFERGASVLCS